MSSSSRLLELIPACAKTVVPVSPPFPFVVELFALSLAGLSANGCHPTQPGLEALFQTQCCLFLALETGCSAWLFAKMALPYVCCKSAHAYSSLLFYRFS